MNEADAISQIKSGDIGGLRTLVELYQAEAVQAASLIIGDRDMAEDVVQQAFLRVCSSIQGFDSSRPFRPWFLRIVTRDAIKAAVRAAREQPLPGDEGGDLRGTLEALSRHTREPEDALEAQELVEAVCHAIARLSPRQRAAVVARYYTGLSTEEAAGRLSCAPVTLRWHLSVAHSRLRRMLSGFR